MIAWRTEPALEDEFKASINLGRLLRTAGFTVTSTLILKNMFGDGLPPQPIILHVSISEYCSGSVAC